MTTNKPTAGEPSGEVKVLHEWELVGDRAARVWSGNGDFGLTIAGHSTHHVEQIQLEWLHQASPALLAAKEIARLASALAQAEKERDNVRLFVQKYDHWIDGLRSATGPAETQRRLDAMHDARTALDQEGQP